MNEHDLIMVGLFYRLCYITETSCDVRWQVEDEQWHVSVSCAGLLVETAHTTLAGCVRNTVHKLIYTLKTEFSKEAAEDFFINCPGDIRKEFSIDTVLATAWGD